MRKGLKAWVAFVGMVTVLLPCLLFYGIARLGEVITRVAERARDWRWLGACADASEAIERWGRGRPKITFPAGRIVTPKYGDGDA